MESLVGLRAVDITEKLGRFGYFTIGSYNKPIAMVVPVVKTRQELIELFKLLERELINGQEKD